MDEASVAELLRRVKEGRVAWLLHVNADPDCVASAHALSEAFGGIVAESDNVSKDGRALAEKIGLDIDPWIHPEQFASVIAVDTSSRSQLGRLGAHVDAPLLVDHHRYGDLQERAPALAWDPARTSCAEVVLDLLEFAGKRPSPTAAFGLLVGLVTDTARFRHANERTFDAARRLVALSGASIESVYAFLEREDEEGATDASGRKATLIAATRAAITEWGPWLVATSEVGAYDAAAAGVLVRAGADLALVANEKNAAARMSLRSSTRARAAGLHLGEIANLAAREVGWSGGGHEAAAGLQGKPPLGPARAAVLRLARQRLESPAPGRPSTDAEGA